MVHINYIYVEIFILSPVFIYTYAFNIMFVVSFQYYLIGIQYIATKYNCILRYWQKRQLWIMNLVNIIEV